MSTSPVGTSPGTGREVAHSAAPSSATPSGVCAKLRVEPRRWIVSPSARPARGSSAGSAISRAPAGVGTGARPARQRTTSSGVARADAAWACATSGSSTTWRDSGSVACSIGGGGRGERGARVLAAEPSRREVARAEVMDTRRQPLPRPRHDVHLRLVERAGRGRGAEEDLAAAGIRLPLRHARHVIEEGGERGEGEPGRRRGALAADRRQRRRRQHVDLARQVQSGDVRVDLEWKWLVLPVELMAAGPHGIGRVRGEVVVAARDRARGHHRTGLSRRGLFKVLRPREWVPDFHRAAGEGPATLCCGSETASASALHRRLGMHIIATSFDLWSTEQLLLVYQRYYGKLDAQARRRIVETARLNGRGRAWPDGVELLAA